jgi:hypothetical protein
MVKYTWHILRVALAGWMNRQQQEVIEYLKEENRILREKLGPGRILLNIAQKLRLATAAFKVGRKLLQDCATVFSPDTLLKWHRTLVARKYDGGGTRIEDQESQRGPGAGSADDDRESRLGVWAHPRWNSRDSASKFLGRRFAGS